jgi:carboxymethylenebutenolidase
MIVRDEKIDIPTPTGPMRTSLYTPVDRKERRPGIVLYSEIFQETEPIRRLAITFAGQGFLVAVPEVYHSQLPAGCVLGYDDAGKEKGNALKKTISMAVFDQDIQAVLNTLEKHPGCNGQLGSLGFCLGGHLAFRAGLDARVLGTACFFPTDLHTGTLGSEQSADTLKRVGEMKGELLLIWGRQDPHIPQPGRRAIYDTVATSGVSFTWHEFNAEHAFMRDEGSRFDPAVAQLCRALAFDLYHRVF